MTTETAMTATTMNAIRDRMIALAFTESADNPENQYFFKALTIGDIGPFGEPIKAAFWDTADDEMSCTVDIVPDDGIVQLFVADLDYVDQFPIGSPQAEQLLELAGAAKAAT